MTLRAQIAFDLSLTTGVNFFTLDDVDKGVLDNTEYVLGGDALAMIPKSGTRFPEKIMAEKTS